MGEKFTYGVNIFSHGVRKNILAVTKILDSIGLQRPQATSLRSQMVDGRRDRAQIFLPGRGRFSDPGGGKFRLAGEEILGPEIRSRTGKSWGPEGQKVDVKKDLFFTLPGQIFALRRGQNPPKISDFGPPRARDPKIVDFPAACRSFWPIFGAKIPPKSSILGDFGAKIRPKSAILGPPGPPSGPPKMGGFLPWTRGGNGGPGPGPGAKIPGGGEVLEDLGGSAVDLVDPGREPKSRAASRRLSCDWVE